VNAPPDPVGGHRPGFSTLYVTRSMSRVLRPAGAKIEFTGNTAIEQPVRRLGGPRRATELMR
jgi:hypothetical protein